jgi:NADH-quinone oxidoreductase subunit L
VSHVLGTPGTYPLLLATWLIPLAGALVLWFFGPLLRGVGAWVGTVITGAAFVCGLASIPDALQHVEGLGAAQALVSWLPGINLGLLLDPLSLVWMLVITGVGFLIHLYAVGYMHGDKAIARFFSYLNFFIFAMLTLVLSDNFVGLLVGWGLVGLASYFLIGFWFHKPSAVAASRKAFVLNVFGDVGIMVAVFILLTHLGTVGYGDVFAHVHQLDSATLLALCIAIFVGCAAKSAQVPLHTWLPDAMEGPTPVSALIHAATMVTAGVYLIARCAPLWNASPDAQEIVGVVGAITALTGAILGVAQWDIKRVLAYSTMSQIGYMIMAVGVGAYTSGVFHFLTHAFFKAMLFLAAGIVIHALSDEQDIRLMGGVRNKAPLAFIAMGIGTLSICGIPPFSGFFSKDAVLYGTLAHGHPYLFGIGAITAGITAYYMFRMLFVVFFGAYRGKVDPSELGIRHPELVGTTAGMPAHGQAHQKQAHHGKAQSGTTHEGATAHAEAHHEVHAHAPAWIMATPVAILIVPSALIGFLAYGGENSLWSQYWGSFFGMNSVLAEESLPLTESSAGLVVLVLVIAGIVTAYARYATITARKHAISRLREESIRMPAILSHAFYFDAAIDALFVKTSQLLGRIFDRIVEPAVIDGTVHEVAWVTRALGHFFRSIQTGFVRAYALIIAVGVACFAAWYGFVIGAFAR